jgi:hypothetical protein
MAITPAKQRNAVSQGMALGLALLDRYELPFDNKMRIDMAFEHAWETWPARCKAQFSQVDHDLKIGTDAVWVMIHADEKKRTGVLVWEWAAPGPIRIRARRHDWKSDDASDVASALAAIAGDVPIDGWLSLAQEFVTHFES